MFRARYQVRVQWGDCDGARIIFYPNYFKMFDTSTHHLFEQAGVPIPELMEKYDFIGMPLVDAHSSFKSPSRWGDRLEVESHVAEWRRKSFVVRHVIWNGDVAAAEGEETRVWAKRPPDQPDGLMAGEIPAELIARFEGIGE